MTGTLAVVGTGFRAVGDITLATQATIEQADEVCYLVADPVTVAWIRTRNPRAESLHDLYRVGKDRARTYAEMVERILAPVRRGAFVCAAFYGHPGVFVGPSHQAIRQAREAGHRAYMLPAPSAEDWLFADLGLDPATVGCQTYEATDFLIHDRLVDPASLLVLWQIGVIGARDFQLEMLPRHRANLRTLVARLMEHHPADHSVAVYRISPYPVCAPDILWCPLEKLADVDMAASSTLVVPPSRRRPAVAAMVERLGAA